MAWVRPAWAGLLWGESPLYETGNFQVSAYQMIDRERKVRDEGNCGRATDRGEEACDRVRKRRVCSSPPGHDLVKAARLRTETSSKAGPVRRACPSVRSRPQSTDQVNGELVQRNITLLSGELCTAWPRPGVAPTIRACPKPWNALAKARAGGAELSRGHSTELPRPTETGRTER
jgi:hypothetical protein